MKTLRFFAFLMLSLTLTLFGTACGTLGTLEDAVDDRLEAAEDRVEDAFELAIEKNSQKDTASENELLAKNSAESIALDHAGLSASEVTGLRTSYEIDDGVPEYEVEFYHDYVEYDYTIHAETGVILSYDRDR